MLDRDKKLWERIRSECDKIITGGKPLARRGGPLRGENGRLHCQLTVYADKTVTEKELYLISANYATRNGGETISVEIDGPYEDASDTYWLQQLEYDKERPGLVDENYNHYTVHKDSAHPGQGDGYGGQEFKIVLTSDELADRVKKAGLKVEPYDYEGEEWYLLTTRNLWCQGYIPRKHRHMFPPNCKQG